MYLDLFPLNATVFPHQKLPLKIFEPRYLELIESCYEERCAFGVCLIKEGNEVGAPAIPLEIGTSVVIEEFSKVSDNLFHIIAKGEKRFRIERIIQEQPHIKADVAWLDRSIPDFPGDYSTLRKISKELLNENYKIPENDNELFGFLGALISINPIKKQKILEKPYNEVIPALIDFFQSI